MHKSNRHWSLNLHFVCFFVWSFRWRQRGHQVWRQYGRWQRGWRGLWHHPQRQRHVHCQIRSSCGWKTHRQSPVYWQGTNTHTHTVYNLWIDLWGCWGSVTMNFYCQFLHNFNYFGVKLKQEQRCLLTYLRPYHCKKFYLVTGKRKTSNTETLTHRTDRHTSLREKTLVAHLPEGTKC